MHELSVMSQLLEIILAEAKKHNLQRITEVQLKLGELTLLAEQQLEFCYKILSESQPLTAGSKLIIRKQPAIIKCKLCGYHGKLEYIDNTIDNPVMVHLQSVIPRFNCPSCGSTDASKIDIEAGCECRLVKLKGIS